MRITAIIFLIFTCSKINGQSLKPDYTPADLYNSITQNPALKENFAGEPFAWHAANDGDLFVKAYRVWKDTAWLNWGIKYYEFLLSNMKSAPDGYIGLIGPHFRENGLWTNEVISDALVANIILEFCELVMNDKVLKNSYGKKATEYVSFCKKNMIEKWDKRELWKEAGEYGAYIFGNDFVRPNDFSKLIIDDKIQDHSLLSIQYNISNSMGITNLRLYRITGDQFYRDKAEKLFFRLKSNFQFFNNHYLWSYWNPFYEKDILFDSNTCKHWVGVHGFRPGYQAIEVSQIIEAYHTGVVFDSTDIQRIINTNLDVMWNKSTEHPEYIMSTGQRPDSLQNKDVQSRGTLWGSLEDFSQTIQNLNRKENEGDYASKDIGGKIQQAYFDSIVVKTPPSFKRKYADGRPIIVNDVPFGNSPDLRYTGVIPYIIKPGENSYVIAKSITTGNLTVDLYTKDGSTKIRTMYSGKIIGDGDGLKGFQMIKWNGTDPNKKFTFKGDYLVRWTLNGKYRNCAITIE